MFVRNGRARLRIRSVELRAETFSAVTLLLVDLERANRQWPALRGEAVAARVNVPALVRGRQDQPVGGGAGEIRLRGRVVEGPRSRRLHFPGADRSQELWRPAPRPGTITRMSDTPTPALLARWRALAGGRARPFGTGLINRTFLVEARAGRFVLQKLHPVFAGVVNEDIDAVTAHLQAKGLVTPRPVRTDDGALWVDGPDGRPWRVLSYVEGTSVDAVDTPARAREAGQLVARFHTALADLVYDYHHVRGSVHDTRRHLDTLSRALDGHRAHRLYDRVAPVAEELLTASRALPDFSALPRRHAHGDLKISNVLFDAQARGLCLVDLDTLGRMPWPHELGDALRSWCNPAGEDVFRNVLDPAIFRAAVEGYAALGRAAITRAESDLLVSGLSTICLELAARFLADALEESYFGWNPGNYATRGDHNLVRALGQWSLHQSVEERRGELERTTREAFSR